MVEIFAQSCSKNGESGFTGNIVQDAGMGAIETAAIIVTKQLQGICSYFGNRRCIETGPVKTGLEDHNREDRIQSNNQPQAIG